MRSGEASFSDALKASGRRAKLAVLLVVAATAFLALGAVGASAAPYVFDPAASEELSNTVPGGAFAEPFGVTFDSVGNLYITDQTGHESKGIVDKFNDENVFQAQLGASTLSNPFIGAIAVNDETGHVYVGDAEFLSSPFFGSLYALEANGTPLSQWLGTKTAAGTFGEHFVQVAVDNSPSVSHGDIYAATANAGGEIDIFRSLDGDAEEGEFLGRLGEPGQFQFEGQEGLAVDSTTGQVYVADQGHKVVEVFSPTGAFETQITGPRVGEPFKQPVAVAVNGANGHVFVVDNRSLSGYVIDEFNTAGELLAQIRELAPDELFGAVSGVAVQESGPLAGAVYVVDAARKQIDVFVEEPPTAPRIEAEGIRQLTESSATFVGEVDPRGDSTGYRFEFGPCASPTSCALSPYPASVPVPDASLSFEDFTAHPVAPQRVAGLLGATTYHFRLVADNAEGEVRGEEQNFTTRGGATTLLLPDGRQWELVSPADKRGASLSGGSETGIAMAAANGQAVSYLADSPTEAAPLGAAAGVQVLSVRGGGGWVSQDLSTPHTTATGDSPGTAPPYRAFAEDLSAVVVQPFGTFEPGLSPEASEQTPYLEKLGACNESCFRPVVTGKTGFSNVPPETAFGEELQCEQNNGIESELASICGPQFEGASPDASHIIIRSAASLTEGAPEGEVIASGATVGSLYEWSAGRLQLISVLPPNEPGGPERPAPVEGRDSQPRLGAELGRSLPSARRAISTDGSRIFWESGGALYLRDTVRGKSLQIDATEPGCLPTTECQSGGGRFQIASADGSRVFFTDFNRLTSNSGASPEKDHKKADLYECQIVEEAGGVPACRLTDLTPLTAGERAEVQGDVLGASEDGTSIYFVADGVLATNVGGNGAGHDVAQSGQPNLYLSHQGSITFIATLSDGDEHDWAQALEKQMARVSPNGRWLAFMSERSLTGYGNQDAISRRPDAEAYIFDETNGKLFCASCNPSGAQPIGVEYRKLENGTSEALPAVREEWEADGWVAALLPHTLDFAAKSPGYQPRYLSDDGRLYFNSLDALVPQDTNGTGDVYQYEPAGVGSCTTTSSGYHQSSGGCVDLISSGTSPEASAFIDASESGDDVFFFTSSRLSPLDVDNQQDVYDAHVCTAEVTCLPEPTPSAAPCSGEACQPAAAPPAEVAPSSQTFTGPGNPLTCRKDQVKKGGKCVKKKPAKKQQKKKGKKSKKGHARPKSGNPKDKRAQAEGGRER